MPRFVRNKYVQTDEQIDDEEIRRRREIVSKYASRFHKSGDVFFGGSTYYAVRRSGIWNEEEDKVGGV